MAKDTDARNLVQGLFEAMKTEKIAILDINLTAKELFYMELRLPSSSTLAENLVFKIFPERIRHLNDLLAKPEFRITSNDFAVTSEMPTMVKTDNNVNNCGEKIQNNDSNAHNVDPKQPLPSNKKLSEFMEIVKPHIKQLLEDINALKIWISILIPKIEDGNNFGVEVQEQALGDIYNIEKAIHTQYILFVQYYEERAKLVTKVLKYPEVEDYRKSVKEHDEHHKIIVSQTMQELRDYYITIHDVITKNLDKIKKPRSSHTDVFY